MVEYFMVCAEVQRFNVKFGRSSISNEVTLEYVQNVGPFSSVYVVSDDTANKRTYASCDGGRLNIDV